MRMLRTRVSGRLAALLIAVAASALVVGCAGGADESKGAEAPGAKASAPASKEGGAGAAAVNVDLSEWSVKASASGKAGAVSFTAKNGGSTPHELLVLKTDVDPGALQKNASGVVDETKYTVSGKTKQLNEGQSEKLELNLTAGKYVLLCNVAGHYDLGMRTAFAVN